MNLSPAACYRAVLARDVRYDGRFFTCVKTTGIYCRPICPARPPKMANCIFVPTAAAAQEAGYRPCLRCRPESAPDLDAWRGTSATVSRALKLIEGGALDDGDVNALAGRLQIGDRHLRRLFRQHIGAAPVTVAQTRRVLLAKQLIHQTDLSMIQVALASGFGSVRRFNETFQNLYRRPPAQLRRRAATTRSLSPKTSLLLTYRPPYDWHSMLSFLKARAIEGLEFVTEGSYSRVIEIGGAVGSIEICDAPQNSALRVTVHLPELSTLPAIITRIRRMFDLSADPIAIGEALCADPLLAPHVAARAGLRVPGSWDPFEIAVRAILGQQITVIGATRLASRLVADLGDPIPESIAIPGLTHAFPQPKKFTAAALSHFKMPRARTAAIVALAAAFRADSRLFDPRQDLDTVVAHLRELPGIGEWTAQYIAMRGLGESDAFLAHDLGVQKKLATRGRRPTANQIIARAARWQPWRAYAVMHLWMSDTKIPQSFTAKETYHALTA
jgi:AraC family transcriptional regulator, regulatory protein of adaptative response / DNA-3-methyladenine glycosylase II